MVEVCVDGHAVQCAVYEIADARWYRLYDLAYLLADTDARFDLLLDEEKVPTGLLPGGVYHAIGSELTHVEEETLSIFPDEAQLEIENGSGETLSTLAIEGEYVVSLDALGSILGLSTEQGSNDSVIVRTNPDLQSDVTYLADAYGVPDFGSLIGVTAYIEQSRAFAYRFTDISGTGHSGDCIAVFSTALEKAGYTHTAKLRDSNGHPVALFENPSRNLSVLVGSEVIDGNTALAVVLSATGGTDEMTAYLTAIAEL